MWIQDLVILWREDSKARMPGNGWIGGPTGWPGSVKEELNLKIYPNTCVTEGEYTSRDVKKRKNLKAVSWLKSLGAWLDEDMKSLKYLEVLLLS